MLRIRPFRPAWIALVLAVVAGMIGATPVYAITGGQPDDGTYYQVGMIYDFTTGLLCTGTLISPTVLLTAGHCTSALKKNSDVWVTFDNQASSESVFHEVKRWDAHPAYEDPAWPWTVDIGVVILKNAVDIEPAWLVEPGTLEGLIPEQGASDQVFVDVGYGQAGVETGGGRPEPAFLYQRRVSWQTYHPGGNEWVGAIHGYDELMLQLKASPSSQHGSGCGGDSGGPIFLDGTYGIVAIHTGGSRLGYDGSICGRISSMNHRIDTETVQDWLGRYI